MNSQGVSSLILMLVFIALIYFIMIRPQRKRDKEEKEMRASLRVGDEIITIGGVIGKITKITDKSVVVITGSEKNKIEFLKTAVASVNKSKAVRNEDEKAENQAEAADEKTPDRDKKVTPKKLTRKSDSDESAAV